MAYQMECEDGSGRRVAPDALAPLLEGARARGVADALELAGQAAILLGGAGDVLHAGESAKRLLGDGLRLANGRLIMKDSEYHSFDRLLSTALDSEESAEGAVHEGGLTQGIILPIPDGGSMRVRILPFEGGKKNPAQLLKAIVLLDRLNFDRSGVVNRP